MEKLPQNRIELLAPAASLSSGRAAIDAGADALYIGGAAFGAREKAGNSVQDIAALASYAHLFGAKLYLTMNTIIYDSELEAAQRLVWEAWQAGIDALIVQDMGLLEMSLPPVVLHASTQTFNLTVDRVKFLEDVGFERVILERGITLDEIRIIRAATSVELEAFVHGAICVGYSGQCYLSESLCGRSGNRGACAQPCRSEWNLIQNDKIISRKQTLLSVTDMNLSQNLPELIEAGITSLKIEGRLKDESYVVNNTAHYNRKLTSLGIKRTSEGESTPAFVPNPEKSFSRSFSDYFLKHRTPVKSLLTDSQGEYLGTVTRLSSDYFCIDNSVKINNGDGISFAGSGTNINQSSGEKIYPNRMDGIAVGNRIYRNLDRSFTPTAVRKIEVVIRVSSGRITAVDSQGNSSCVDYEAPEALNVEKAAQNIISALSKSGDTPFKVKEVVVEATPFMPISSLNEQRRILLAKLLEARVHHRQERIDGINHPCLGIERVDYRANIANSLARQFYERCGVAQIAAAYELEKPPAAVLLRTRHCIRREMGICLKQKGSPTAPLTIENNGRRLLLAFDCAACEMSIIE